MDLAGIVMATAEVDGRAVQTFGDIFARNGSALETLLYIVISGLAVRMNARIDEKHQVQDFDRGGLFTIEPVGGTSRTGEVRLQIPRFRLNALRVYLGRAIRWLYDYQDLFPFPSFTMRPELFEAAVAAVLAARLNALRSTRGEAIAVRDIFPGCSMSSRAREEWVSVPPAMQLQQETVLGDTTTAAARRRRRLSQHVTTALVGKVALAESAGIVLHPTHTAACIDVHLVLPYPVKPGMTHFGIQCKSGDTERFDALAMYEEAMAYMAPVADMDHYFVLAALQPDRVQRPPMAQWPDGLIVVDSVAEFAPLMRTMPLAGDAARGEDAEGGSTASRRR